MKVVFRADGNTKIGLGHVFRVLAIADIIADRYDCAFALYDPEEVAKKIIKKSGYPIIQLENQMDISYIHRHDIVVIDGYDFLWEYQLSIYQAGKKLVCIDDIQHTSYCANAVINHCPGIKKEQIQRENYTALFLGLEYAILRMPFIQAHSRRKQSESDSIFVCFGGSDPHNLNMRVLDAIEQVNSTYQINLVTSSSNPHLATLQNHERISLSVDIEAEQMASIMIASDFAIVPASTVLFETLALDLPTLSGYYTDNQQLIYNGFLQEKVIHGVGNFLSMRNEDLINEIEKFVSKESRSLTGKLIDGKSHIRLREVFDNL